MKTSNEVYLGDGLYASFDGYQYMLRAPREDGDHFVFLEPVVLDSFDQFRAKTEKSIADTAGVKS